MRDTFTPYGYGKNTTEYSIIDALVSSMESMLSADQMKRILRAAECGGLDAGMKSLQRVSAQIAKERSALRNTIAYQAGQLMAVSS